MYIVLASHITYCVGPQNFLKERAPEEATFAQNIIYMCVIVCASTSFYYRQNLANCKHQSISYIQAS